MSQTVLGLSAFFHSSACCLLRDGQLLFAAEEERFSRVKYDRSVPWRAFRAGLNYTGIRMTEIDCLAFYEDPTLKRQRQEWMQRQGSETGKARHAELASAAGVERALRRGLGFEGLIQTFPHHLSHAASAFHFSGFDEAAILTVDGVGEWATTTYGRGQGRGIELFEEIRFPDSLGLFYSSITSFLGFNVNDGEYKVMGLAAHGRPRLVDELRQLIEVGEAGQIHLRSEYFDYVGGDSMYSDRLTEFLGHPPRAVDEEIQPFHRDLAASAQHLLEELLLEKVSYLHRRVGSSNLCMAGGVALNCVANSRLLREGPFQRLFVPPAAGDAGGALGAAVLAHLQLEGAQPLKARLVDARLGPDPGRREIERLMLAAGSAARSHAQDSGGLLDATVDRLVAGKVVGWFQGRMELGPRALGARSILADPRRPDIRDRINASVKRREGFRPFAPAVLADQAEAHFDLDHESPFMLETAQVISPLDLPAITHVDGSARVQTVAADAENRFFLLLQRFFERTGCPVLLDTSFNQSGEPIVGSPIDAILCFIRAGLDSLVIGDHLLDREASPPFWRMYVESRRPPRERPTSMYELF